MESLDIGLIHMGFFYSGGGERTVLRQAKYLGELGHRVIIYAPIIADDCFPELRQDLECQEMCGWIPETTPLRPALSMIMNSMLIPVGKLAKNDVLIAHGQPSNWIAHRTEKKTGTPYYSYLHQVNRFQKPRQIDISGKWGPDKNIQFLKMINENNIAIKKLDISSISHSNGVITNSFWIKNQVEEYYRVDPVICYPGIKKKEHPSIEKKNTTILTTNRHYPQKRIDYLLRIMEKVGQKVKDIRCIISGGFTKHTQRLIETRDELGLKEKVHFTGILSEGDLGKAYGEASIYSFTSPEEDLGLGPLEAASYGTPSVVWDHAGPRETVVDRVTGIRVDPYDLDQMCNEICDLLADENRINQMGYNAWKHVNKHFSWEKHCERLCKIISK